MSEAGSRRGRTHDAAGAREAILNAAEAVFAEHGFDGARIDAIAAGSGYNKSLLFHYFGDKLGLYTEVTKRADQEMGQLQVELFGPLLEDESIASDASKFRVFLEEFVGLLFDYLKTHPRLIRIIQWEQAEGWQTYKKILSQFEVEDTKQFEAIFNRARKAGLLRSDYSPIIQFIMSMQTCLSFFSWLPLYEMMFPNEDLASTEALARGRAYLVNFIVNGIMVNPNEQ